MPGFPGPDHVWRRRGRLSPPPRQSILTFAEVKALRQAFSTGRFSKVSLGKIYDISNVTVANALKDTYRPRKDF